MSIEWKEGAVCYANEVQFYFDNRHNYKLKCFSECVRYNYDYAIKAKDLQLNEPKEGYYIPKSELDTEEKYNQAVEVFGLFGYWRSASFIQTKESFDEWANCLDCDFNGYDLCASRKDRGVKLTFNQLMAIGELKRKMNERDGLVTPTDLKGFAKDFNTPEGSTIKGNKSKQAYQILTSMDIEWDNIKMKWYKRSGYEY